MPNVSSEEFRALWKRVWPQRPCPLGAAAEGSRRPHKYHAVPRVVDGIRFHSTREAEVYLDLCYQLRVGMIAALERQVRVELPGEPPIVWLCDFRVTMPDGQVRYVEVKGVETPEWKLKKRLLRAHRPDIYAALEVLR